jgi:DegV family protein with EDD domain
VTVKIVTDSAADIPPELAQELDITVVPLTVLFGEANYRDGVEIDADQFYSMLATSDVFPTTSAPAVAEFQTVYDRLLEEADAIVSIHVPAKLSGTINAALSAKGALTKPVRIEIVDSQTVSLGLGMIAIVAARAAKAGAGLNEVVRIASDAVPNVSLYFALETLEYLKRGGRIGRAQAFLGSLLSVRPVLAVRDGEVHPVARERTRARAVEHIVGLLGERKHATDIAIVHANTPDEADHLQQRLKSMFPTANIYSGRISPVLGAHAGPGVIGAGVLEGGA